MRAMTHSSNVAAAAMPSAGADTMPAIFEVVDQQAQSNGVPAAAHAGGACRSAAEDAAAAIWAVDEVEDSLIELFMAEWCGHLGSWDRFSLLELFSDLEDSGGHDVAAVIRVGAAAAGLSGDVLRAARKLSAGAPRGDPNGYTFASAAELKAAIERGFAGSKYPERVAVLLGAADAIFRSLAKTEEWREEGRRKHAAFRKLRVAEWQRMIAEVRAEEAREIAASAVMA